ncbi:MAG: hypothetical protein D6741_01160 [Planctomycetota bacterium]|nr:MAG: hypothetical protein D6741_01160 [Planctomycetota bacterium]
MRVGKCVSVVLVAFLAGTGGIVSAVEPVDPELIPEGRRVLEYLHEIYGQKTLAGIASYGGRRPVQEICGRLPAVYGEDAFGWNKPKWGKSYTGVMDRNFKDIHDWWHIHGGIPQMQFHWGKPGDPNGSAWVSGDKGTGPVDVKATITPGTPEHEAAMEDLRRTADYLERLHEAQVPILWRPFHEIEGGWFWWTDKETPENTAALWRMMYDYLVNERGLHNLIWVYSSALRPGGLPKDASLEDEIAFRKRYYPGDEYVDFVGIDIYPNDYYGWGNPTEDTYRKAFEIMQKVAPGKMIALCECAAIPNPDMLAEKGPGWLYALPWFVGGQNPPEWIAETFSHAQIVTLDEMPQLVPHNIAPTARIASPADGAQVPTEFSLAVNLKDRDGNLLSASLYVLPGTWKDWAMRSEQDILDLVPQARLIAERATSREWIGMSAQLEPGLYDVMVMARDSAGMVGQSNVVRVIVGLEDLARGKPVEASSHPETAAAAVDGNMYTPWSGAKEGEQWITVDLEQPQRVGAVAATWWKAYAKAYRVELSTDGKTWTSVAEITDKRGYEGDTDIFRFEPQTARYVRLSCREPGTSWGGYTLYNLSVFEKLPE